MSTVCPNTENDNKQNATSMFFILSLLKHVSLEYWNVGILEEGVIGRDGGSPATGGTGILPVR
jgi:hypothetical protein